MGFGGGSIRLNGAQVIVAQCGSLMGQRDSVGLSAQCIYTRVEYIPNEIKTFIRNKNIIVNILQFSYL